MSYPIAAEPTFTFCLNVGVPVETGNAPDGRRRFLPILGGTVTGLHPGIVLPGGGDRQTILVDGSIEVVAQYVLDSDGAKIVVRSRGVRTAAPEVLARLAAGEIVAPDQYYFRTAIRLATGSERFAHVNRQLFVSTGERRASQVHLSIYSVL